MLKVFILYLNLDVTIKKHKSKFITQLYILKYRYETVTLMGLILLNITYLKQQICVDSFLT